MKALIVTAIRFFAVTILYFLSFVFVSGALLSQTSEQPATSEAGATLFALFVVSLISAAVWTYVILCSRWSGWKLFGWLIILLLCPARVVFTTAPTY